MFRWIKYLFLSGVLLCVAGVLTVTGVLFYYTKDLPDYHQLSEYHPPIVTRLYANNGQPIEEYAKEKRLFVPIQAIPQSLINAFLSAEDKNFFEHSGIDMFSIIRAALTNIMNIGRQGQLVGGSTITQQVVKNFLLTNEQTIERKIKEAVLAIRITRAFSKEKILELYLNQIYLGNRSYGVAAAALNYFNKSINELTVDEMALLAALPKAPSEFNPYRNPNRAQERRDWVLTRMLSDNHITEETFQEVINSPIRLRSREPDKFNRANYFAEAVRRIIFDKYGERTLYEGGLSVSTTLDPILQNYAMEAFRQGLTQFDRRKGWRGPLTHVNLKHDWLAQLDEYQFSSSIAPWETAIVLEVNSQIATIGLHDGHTATMSGEHMKWARPHGSSTAYPNKILKKGDIIAVEPLKNKTSKKDKKKNKQQTTYYLRQIPEVNGGMVVLDPFDGKVKALVGGFYSENSQFNRAIQAKRQPGSAFKPFVYLTALEKGFTPASIVVDAPISLDQGPGLPAWQPQNYSGEFYGPTPLRQGLEYSRNAMTVQLSQMIGLESILDVGKRFNILNDPSPNYSLVLGSAETTLLNLTNAYAMIANGGKRVYPSLIERIQDRNGNTLYRRDLRICTDCILNPTVLENVVPIPDIPDTRDEVVDPQSAYQLITMLEGVVKRGTGRRALRLNRTIGGKTGTTNNAYDAWFMGFTTNLVVGVYVGYDNPKSLGKKETGSSVALPIFIAFMEKALAGQPDVPFPVPPGIRMVNIDRHTGLLPGPYTEGKDIILEAFKAGTEPLSSDDGLYFQPKRERNTTPFFSPSYQGTGGIY